MTFPFFRKEVKLMEDVKPTQDSPHTDFNGMPCGKLGAATVSRLVFDGNPLVGNVHSRDLKYVSRLAKTYFTPECLQETLRLAEANGIVDVNLMGTVNLLEAARKVGAERFVFTSSSGVYAPSAARARFLTEDSRVQAGGLRALPGGRCRNGRVCARAPEVLPPLRVGRGS